MSQPVVIQLQVPKSYIHNIHNIKHKLLK